MKRRKQCSRSVRDHGIPIRWTILSAINLLLMHAAVISAVSSPSSNFVGRSKMAFRGGESAVLSTVAAPEEEISVVKRDGRLEPLNRDKLLKRLKALSLTLSREYISPESLTDKILSGMYPNVTTSDIDTLASETAASMSTIHPDYGTLAASLCISHMHKNTSPSFCQSMISLHEDRGNRESDSSFIHPNLMDLCGRRSLEIDAQIEHELDSRLTYFGYKTLERAYLLKQIATNRVIERPQYLFMRVALGLHCCSDRPSHDKNSKEREDANLMRAFETYRHMSRGMFTHASPTLFHAGTTHSQLSSCFLLQMSDDSIHGIYDTLKRCAVISKSAGGIGLSAHNIRARGTPIAGTRGISNGLVPMLRVFDVTSRYVDQGGGKRPGAFAIYLEPWHADIFDVLNLKKNHGKEEQRARDLFYGLWVPDLFMKRIEEDGDWSLMCPHQSPGLQDCYGEEFERLYEKYEKEERYVRKVKARELWGAILDAQVETGTPYMLYKDHCNRKTNQNNLGTIQCSNLCTEIVQYTDEEEVAVCNLASICLPKFVVSQRGPYGSIQHSPNKPTAFFNHTALHQITKIITRNLNKIIDINQYPTEGAQKSNMRHRPIGIGVSGLADAFLRLGLPFCSDEAKELNAAIFETIYHAALEASNELAQEEGTYETFPGSPTSRGDLQFHLWGMKDDETPSHNPDRLKLHMYPNQKGYDWTQLRQTIIKTGLRNSLLVAPMPTASTSQILGVNECFEPFVSNLYLRRVKAGEFIMANPHLLTDLVDRGLWTPSVRNQLMRDGGSVAKIECIPTKLKELYKTVWEIRMKDIIDMAADRGKFIDQSQSLNMFMGEATVDKLTAMHFYAWKKGLKTGMYYLRTRPAVNAIQYTVEKDGAQEAQEAQESFLVNNRGDDDDNICISCQG